MNLIEMELKLKAANKRVRDLEAANNRFEARLAATQEELLEAQNKLAEVQQELKTKQRKKQESTNDTRNN